MKRKLFSLLIICSLILCIAPPASATGSVGLSPTSFVLQQVSIIDSADPTCPWNNDTTFSSITPLYNLDNTINGYIVKLLTDGEDSGFIQIHVINGLFSVYCYAYEGISEVDSMAEYWEYDLSNEIVYFLGSFKYLISTSDGYLDLASNTLLDVDLPALQAKEVAYANQVQSTPLVLEEPSFLATQSVIITHGSEDDYTWPVCDDFKSLSISYNGTTHNGIDNHCTPTAATGIFRYLNHLGRTNCTSGENTNQTFEKMYIALNTNNIRFSTNTGDGTSRGQIAVGLRWYATNNNCALTIEQANFNTLNSMKSHIDNGRLLLVSVDNFENSDSDPSGHSIVVTGYSSNTLCIQNGWIRNSVMYSYSSLDIAQYVYIG